ncbi:hypothetical protein CgunFtcFv8_006050 [Champsocephalus gunnari]|uniref:protein-serine/threonine phosphatase n=1 Tax=Champsocephalus gunnari TaxID=52237 RepID=A0AAN8GVQ1_CHAGU|nr:hypothetical protein CgunFtcFv8_006050 [Champsocephalus gunnari]
MSSPVVLHLLRCSRSLLTRRPSHHTCTAPGQVGGASNRGVGVRFVSGAVSVRPVAWDSFGIWDDRIEEPVLLPSSIRYGKHNPQASVSRVGSSSVLGLRKQNEDRLRVARIHENIQLYAVFDGHGGPHAAEYCYTFMEKYIRDALEEDDDLERVLKKAFLDVDKALHTHLSYCNNPSFLTAGTTATVAMLRGEELVVGNAGDSRAILSRGGEAKKLTRDHCPDLRDERERIKRCGGFVTWNSAGVSHVNGRLAMTRSIGDFHLKTSGVIAEPETRRVTLNHDTDSFLALTTDGINFLLSDQEICDVINKCHDPTEAAEVIAQQALQYGSEDNASVVVVPLSAWGKHQSSAAVYSMSRNFASSGRWA